MKSWSAASCRRTRRGTRARTAVSRAPPLARRTAPGRRCTLPAAPPRPCDITRTSTRCCGRHHRVGVSQLQQHLAPSSSAPWWGLRCCGCARGGGAAAEVPHSVAWIARGGRWPASVGPDAPVAPGASATGDNSEAHDADERVEQGGGAARMTTTLELTPECGSAGGTLSIRLGLAGLLSLLPWRRRRKYDGDDDWGITGAGGAGRSDVKAWS
jgi:hypothetical protein